MIYFTKQMSMTIYDIVTLLRIGKPETHPEPNLGGELTRKYLVAGSSPMGLSRAQLKEGTWSCHPVGIQRPWTGIRVGCDESWVAGKGRDLGEPIPGITDWGLVFTSVIGFFVIEFFFSVS